MGKEISCQSLTLRYGKSQYFRAMPGEHIFSYVSSTDATRPKENFG